jgi:hypothetical protein
MNKRGHEDTKEVMEMEKGIRRHRTKHTMILKIHEIRRESPHIQYSEEIRLARSNCIVSRSSIVD